MPDRSLRYILAGEDKGASAAFARVAASAEALNLELKRLNNETALVDQGMQKAQKSTENAHQGAFKPLLDTALLLGPALGPVAAGAVAAGAGLAGMGAAGLLAFEGIKREITNSTGLGIKYQQAFAPVVDEFHNLEHIAALNVFGGINQGISQVRTLFPLLNQDVAALSTHLGSIAGHTGAGIVALLHDLNPLMIDLAGALDKAAAGFQHWATTSQGPAKFVAYAETELPKVEALFRDLATAVVHVAEAGAPLGDALLQALDGIASAVSRIPVPVLTAMIVALDAGRLAKIAGGLSGVSKGLEAIGLSAGAAGPIVAGLTIIGAAWAVSVGQQAQQQAALAQATNDVTAALQASNGVFTTAVRNQFAKTAADTGALDSLDKLGLSQAQYLDALTKGKPAQDAEVQRILDAAKAKGLSKDATVQLLGPLGQQVNAVQQGTDKWNAEAKAVATATTGLDAGSIAIANQQKFLADNNLTLAKAAEKYNDAVEKAHTFTAELGYMSKALDDLSNNNINATLQQDQLNLSMGTSADQFAASRKQVHDHGTALQGNTDDAISNRDWALQQIQAINQQALSYAKSTGSIDLGTGSLKTNEAALRTSMSQAGFTKKQIDDLITSYAATPGDVKTLVEEQGSAAVLAALGDILNQLHAIADPVWGAKFDFAMNNPSLARGRAAGGLVNGPGSGTSDSIWARVSTGEYVVNAAATQKNLGLLENINANKFAGGGLVGNLIINTTGLASEIGQFNPALFNALNAAAAKNAAQAAQAGGVPGVSGPASADVAALQAYALSLFRYYNWDGSQLSSLISLWNGESGWNPQALNASSGAFGIPQSLPADKMATAGPDWRTNGNTQIRWGENYINSVYGSPSAAYGAWLSRSPHWYGQGAWNVPADQLAFLHRKELVMDAQSAEKFRSGGGGGIVVSSGAITVYAAPGMDEGRVAAQAFSMLRQWIAAEDRKAAMGGRA